MEKKRILVLVDWFAPGYKAGGPIQSCVNFSFAMKNDYSIYVLTTDTDHGETHPYTGITSGRWTNDMDPDIRVFYLEKTAVSAKRIREQIDAVHADYVYLNHMWSPLFVLYPLWLKFSGRLKGEIVLCPRGALYESALSVKRWKKKPILSLFRWLQLDKRILFHATNERERSAILQHLPGSRVLIADNLPNMHQPPFKSLPKERGNLRCIFIARIVPIKNLQFLLGALEKVKAEVELSIIGPIEDQAYWKECTQKIAQLPANINVDYLGPMRNDELMAILQHHHLFALPTTGENFGHSIFEALLAGRPVLISDQTPWLGLAGQKAGWDLPLADPDAFTRVIEDVAQQDQEVFDYWAQSAWTYAHKFIKNPELHGQYLKLFA